MGHAAKEKKPRVCQFCKNSLYLDAKGLKQHANLCERAQKIGLVLQKALIST